MNRSGAIDIFLQPGEFFVGDAAFCIRTLLGSCVSITLWAPARRIGAMSHCLLASRQARGQQPDGRYLDEALRLMLDGLAQAGVSPRECRAKIFGGGNMFPGHQPQAGKRRVGESNGAAARQLLQAAGIPVESEDLFGAGYRQIIFDISTGHVWCRRTAVGRRAKEPA